MKLILTTLPLFAMQAQAAIVPNEFPLSFDTATQREDGSALPLGEIAGNKSYCGSAVDDYQIPVFYAGATLPRASIIIKGLPAGVNHCVLTTIDTDGRESQYSPDFTLTNNGEFPPKAPALPAGANQTIQTTLP